MNFSNWNLYFLLTSLLKSLLSLYFPIEISTFSLLFYWSFYFLFNFSLEISTSEHFSQKSLLLSTFLKNLSFWALFSKISTSEHFTLEISTSKHFSLEISTSEHFSLEISTSDRFSLEISTSEHFSLEISTSDRFSLEISTSEHFSLEIPTSEHFSLEISSSEHLYQSHLDTTFTMWFATWCMHFPLAQCHHPQPSTTSLRFPNNTAPPWKPLITFPNNTAPPSTTQHHLEATATLRLTTCIKILW